MTHERLAETAARYVPRSIGDIRLASKRLGDGSAIAQLRTSGASKVMFTRRRDAVEGVLVNTSGGLTGGDRFTARFKAGARSKLVLTSQAAERAYRSAEGVARVRTQLRISNGARLDWLPQEFIVFDGAAVARKMDIDIAEDAELIFVEPVVFGRKTMGEVLNRVSIRDTITLMSEGRCIYRDRICLSGPVGSVLERISVAAGCSSLATVLYHGPRAEALLPAVRRALPETGGASLMSPRLLCLRAVAEDSFLLRRSLIPILEILADESLPKSWSL